MIIEIDNVLVSMDILTEQFVCDLEKCKGICCVEGDAGAPVTQEEIGEIERYLDYVFPELSAAAQTVIDTKGVAYHDKEGELVTSIVNGRDCIFTCYQDLEIEQNNQDNLNMTSSDRSKATIKNCCLCAFERAYRAGRIKWCKPISCALYPIREAKLSNGLTAITYNQWDICKDAVEKGRREGVFIYQFLRDPLIKRFGEAWYKDLCLVAEEIRKQNIHD